MTTIEWIEAFLKFDPQAWKNVLAYTIGSLIGIGLIELIKIIINKTKKDNKK